MKTTRSLRLGILAAVSMWCAHCAAVPAIAAAQQPSPSAPQQTIHDQLARAVADHDLARTKAALTRGANPNTVLFDHPAAGTVLHAAALDNRIELVRCLLDHGAEPVRHNSQFETPRALAERAGHAAIAELLRQTEEGTYVRPAGRSLPPQTTHHPVPKTKTPTTTRTIKSRTSAKNNKTKGPETAAERRAKTLKKLNDYNYVKQNFGLGGTTYRSNKW